MRRVLFVLFVATAALVAAVAVWVALTAPPRAAQVPDADGDRVAWGAYHVHSTRSDGSGSVDEIAAAAARAGLDFVIFTDHGDATRPLEPAQYRHGVLCIDAVEINSAGGHVVALNLQRPSAYPLAGEARDVVDDIHRLGGLAVAAHPESPRQGLSWRSAGAAIDGVEWLNADTEWRGHPATTLLRTAAHAAWRAPEAISSLFRPPAAALQRWDAASRSRPVFALAAVDAHARMGTDDDSGWGGWNARFPSYEALFRSVAQVVILDAPPTGNGLADGRAVLSAIAGGRTFSTIRAFVDGRPALEFAATHEGGRVAMGDVVPAGVSATIRAVTPAVPAARLVLRRDGREVAQGRGRMEFHAPAGPAAYRLEAFVDRDVPWLVTNPIYFAAADSRAGVPAGPTTTVPLVSVAAAGWQIERDPTSKATIHPEPNGLRFEYTLGPGAPSGQYVALAAPTGELVIDRIEFIASAPRPMRLSLQVRLPGGADGQRWRRSVYVDETPRAVAVRLADLDPVNRRSSLRPIAARVQSLLVVIDTVNARPGTAGELRLADVRLVPATSAGPSTSGR